MEARESENHGTQEGAGSDDPTRPEGVRVFATDAWIPMWEQSTPGERIVLGSVPTSCNLYLEPEPHFAIEVNLEGQEALGHHRILTQQGEQVPIAGSAKQAAILTQQDEKRARRRWHGSLKGHSAISRSAWCHSRLIQLFQSEATTTLRVRGILPIMTCSFTPNIAYWTKD